MKLLYAEDEPTMAEAVVDILTYHNYLVDAVSDGEDALSYTLSETTVEEGQNEVPESFCRVEKNKRL